MWVRCILYCVEKFYYVWHFEKKNKLKRVENNGKYVKLIFCVSKFKFWKPNLTEKILKMKMISSTNSKSESRCWIVDRWVKMRTNSNILGKKNQEKKVHVTLLQMPVLIEKDQYPPQELKKTEKYFSLFKLRLCHLNYSLINFPYTSH